jgi:CubicO group peptidase (beta-lactamase class C family)
MNLYLIPGVSIAVGHGDGEIWTAGYGNAKCGTNTPIDSRTAFQACSISKQVAAFGVLRLVADGVLDLDADIDRYLRSWQLPACDGWRANVTVRQLLAHTAGLSYNWYRGYGQGEAVPTMLQILTGTTPANTPPVRASLLPGSRFRYSGSHFAVLEQLLVDVTGSPFEELMQSLVLGPTAMADSSFDQRFPHTRPESVALGHHHAGTPVAGGWHTIPEMAGAGLWSTPADLARFELEIMRAAAGQSPLLSQELATQMLTPQAPADIYGLGTLVHDRAGHRRFGHSGSGVGYGCFSYVWPDAAVVVAVMANSYDAQELLSRIISAADRLYATGSPNAVAPEEVTGRYLLRDDYPIDITADDDGRLILTAPHQPPALLTPLAGGGYRLPGADLEITFRRGDDDRYLAELRQENITQTTLPLYRQL